MTFTCAQQACSSNLQTAYGSLAHELVRRRQCELATSRESTWVVTLVVVAVPAVCAELSCATVTTGRVAQHSGHTKRFICSLLCSGVYRRRTFDTQGALYSVSSTLVHASVGPDLSLFNTGRVAQHSGRTKRVHLQFALFCCLSAQNF